MLKLGQFIIAFLAAFNAVLFVAHAQVQSGFISLDCGLPANVTYTDNTTEINYISDAAFIQSGETRVVSSEYELIIQQVHRKTLRSFPEGLRNCYTASTEKGTEYLIRATFLYGNYDGKNTTPEFELNLGPNFWGTVEFESASKPVFKEVVHLPVRNYVNVCLINTGSGTPFLNTLELRPMRNASYGAKSEFSLALVFRRDVGSPSKDEIRYPNDAFDRVWTPYNQPDWKKLLASKPGQNGGIMNFRLPNIITDNAATPMNESEPIRVQWNSTDEYNEYYVYMHFAEIQDLKANESREFNINDFNTHRRWGGPVRPRNLISNTIYSGTSITGALNYTYTIEKLENSTLPPILNAIELYMVVDHLKLDTEENDVDAMVKTKFTYKLKRNWGGDPCIPVQYIWTGLNCSVDAVNAPRITSLDLSSSGLAGEITTHIANLNMLHSLDLSNNSLTGPVPNFLTELPNLRVLNLAKNNLTGVVPPKLIEMSQSGTLSLSVEGNQNLCASSTCNNKKKSNSGVVRIVASVIGSFVALAIALGLITFFLKNRKQGYNDRMDSFKSRKRKFSYNEIVKITKSFSRVLGKGGFATVYYGVLEDGIEVAVKKIRVQKGKGNQAKSENGNRRKKDEVEEQYRQFQAEVKVLLTVYHGNLTSLIGYCSQGAERILIYEYMANGDLESHLSDKQSEILTWETRLQIAVDSAQGLEYLHSGCNLSIVHRDIKTANILISADYRAKLADFGLSKFFLTEDGTHISTMHIAGTPGYIDPDLLANNGMLNEKSDVYSFGVVLLQIITGRPTMSRDNQGNRIHLSEWVNLMISNDKIKSMVDERLCGDYDINSIWKAVEIAMASVSTASSNRPNMTKVVVVLRECLELEKSRKRIRDLRDSSCQILSLSTSNGDN